MISVIMGVKATLTMHICNCVLWVNACFIRLYHSVSYIMVYVLLCVGGEAVIKAQVLAGGRAKGRFNSGLEGGVKLAKS